MSGTIAQQARAPAAGDRFRRARELLAQALEMLDAEGAPPEIGARLEEVIARLDEEPSAHAEGADRSMSDRDDDQQ